MQALKFKTNINCGGCVAKVTEPLNQTSGIQSWKVDTDNPDKILVVETDSLQAETIVEVLDKIGFKAEPVA
jgi:copper chaperone